MSEENGEVLTGIIAILAILVIVVVFVLIGSSIKDDIEYGVKEGTIIDMRYHAAYTTTTYSDKVIIPQYHPENWQIKIQKEINGETKEIWVYVDETTYHELKIGDYYPKEKDK